MKLSDLLGFASGLNWPVLAAKAAALVLVVGLIFGAGYRYGMRDCVSVNSPGTVAAAQHKQDVKQHGVAVAVSGDAGKRQDAQGKNTAVQVQVIHDKPTVIVQGPGCPADPPMDPAVLDAYNKAGH